MSERHGLIDTVADAIVPVHSDGYKFLAVGVAVCLLLFWFVPLLAWPAVLLTAWIAYFFRDPPRVTPLREGLVVAPADGRISAIERVRPPAELGLGDSPRVRISTFLSIFDVHINRAPAAGRIARSVYVPGSFLNAALDKASEENERRALVIATAGGAEIGVVQIAGLIARRIVTFSARGRRRWHRRAVRPDPLRVARRPLSAARAWPAGRRRPARGRRRDGHGRPQVGRAGTGGAPPIARVPCRRKEPAMDPLLPRLETEERRRRGRLLFQRSKIPLRMVVPNFFTVLSLCAGLTALRMAIEARPDMAIALIVIAALLDGVDGRLARALKAQSKFGAELDSLADFVNFGVAPAVLVFVWGLGGLPRGVGWIVALVFALAMGLRLARFNSLIDVEKPKWQANYFTGMPAPAGAIVVLLPLYLDGLGLIEVRAWPWMIAAYMLAMATLLVSTLPTFSGKLLGERISGDYVLPVFVAAAAAVALLLTYPYGALTVATLLYLACLPLSHLRYRRRLHEPAVEAAAGPGAEPARVSRDDTAKQPPAGETRH